MIFMPPCTRKWQHRSEEGRDYTVALGTWETWKTPQQNHRTAGFFGDTIYQTAAKSASFGANERTYKRNQHTPYENKCRTKGCITKPHQLELGGVPEVFVGHSLLELLQGVSPLSLVVRVGFERFSRPHRCPGEVVVVVCLASNCDDPKQVSTLRKSPSTILKRSAIVKLITSTRRC